VISPVAVLHGDLWVAEGTGLAPNPIRLMKETHGGFILSLVGPDGERTEARIFTLTGMPVVTFLSVQRDPPMVILKTLVTSK
jgi:thioredoxin-like negative regulator of GroEL